MAVTGSDQHLTERDCGLNSEQIPSMRGREETCPGHVTMVVHHRHRGLRHGGDALQHLGDHAHRRVAQRCGSSTLLRSWRRASGWTARSAERESLAN
jgi:hypothetical protein